MNACLPLLKDSGQYMVIYSLQLSFKWYDQEPENNKKQD